MSRGQERLVERYIAGGRIDERPLFLCGWQSPSHAIAYPDFLAVKLRLGPSYYRRARSALPHETRFAVENSGVIEIDNTINGVEAGSV
jgi:hypothetical protein